MSEGFLERPYSCVIKHSRGRVNIVLTNMVKDRLLTAE